MDANAWAVQLVQAGGVLGFAYLVYDQIRAFRVEHREDVRALTAAINKLCDKD
jgi:hypothetical protein